MANAILTPNGGRAGVGVGAALIQANSGDIGYCLTASAQQSLDAETETLIAVAHALRGEGLDASEDGTGKGTPIIPVAWPLTAGMAASANRMPQEQGARIPVCFDSKGSQVQTDETGAAPTLRAMTHADSHQNGGGQLAVAFAENQRGRDGGAMPEGPHDTANIRAASGGSSRNYVAAPWAVRRLTPRECERLQGMADDVTNVPWRGKGTSPDGPRYKAIGNSWALNCIEWIGERMLIVDAWD